MHIAKEGCKVEKFVVNFVPFSHQNTECTCTFATHSSVDPKKKISRYEFPTFQGAVYAIIVLGIQNCRVLFGQLPFEVCVFQLWAFSAIWWFAQLVLVLIYSLKFMFVCIWKRMRNMNDNLIVRIFFRYMKKLIF